MDLPHFHPLPSVLLTGRAIVWLLTVTIAGAWLGAPGHASAAAGDLDPTFSGAGFRITDISTGDSMVEAVAIQQDGKIVMAGQTWLNHRFQVALVRLNEDGSLDNSFGTGGITITTLPGSGFAQAVAIQPDGKILVAGYCTSPNADFALLRYLTDGSLDPAFGSDGIVITQAGTGADYGRALALQTDGKILVAGRSKGAKWDAAVVRYGVNGALDSAFGTAGILITSIGTGDDAIAAMALQTDGKILVAGNTATEGTTDFALVRLLDTGARDASFGTNGVVITNYVAGGDDAIHGLALQPDGKIVAAGVAWELGRDVALARYLANGSLDGTFGIGGKLPFSSSNRQANNVLIQPDGRILLAGSAFSFDFGYDMALFRFESHGAPDMSFGTGGTALLHVNWTEEATGIAIAENDKIVMCGKTLTGARYQAVTARFKSLSLPGAFTLPPENITATKARLRGLARANNAHGQETTVRFELSTNGIDYQQVPATPATVTGTEETAIVADVTDLTFNTLYRYRLVVSHSDGTTVSTDATFATAPVPAGHAELSNLTLGPALLTPPFGSSVFGYTSAVPFTVFGVDVTATALNAGISLQLNGQTITSGSPRFLPLQVGSNIITLATTSEDGTAARQYVVTVMRAPPLDGDFDETLGNNGHYQLSLGAGDDQALDVAVQQDGKTVLVGHTQVGTNYEVALVRLTADGLPDPDFGVGGVVKTPVGSGNDVGRAVALQEDGKIIVAGYTQTASSEDCFVLRYLGTGELDTTFGVGGKVITNFAPGNDRLQAVVIQKDGRITAAGYATTGSNRDLLLVRFLPNGSPDDDFGTGGKVMAGRNPDREEAYSLALQADGRIVVSGAVAAPTNEDFAAYRFLPNGEADADFGTAGEVVFALGNGNDVARRVAVQKDGYIVLGGYAQTNGGFDFAAACLTSEGVLDTAFGTAGKLIVPLSANQDRCFGMALAKDGKILMAGSATLTGASDMALLRLNLDGSVDSGFGTNGKLFATFGANPDEAFAVAVQPNGKVLMAGRTVAGGNTDMAVVRCYAAPLASEIQVMASGGNSISNGGGYTFGATGVGGLRQQIFTIANQGNARLERLRLKLQGPDADRFSLLESPATLVMPGQTTRFVVQFAPLVQTHHQATIVITSNDVDDSPFTLQLNGEGNAAQVVALKTLRATAIDATSATLNAEVVSAGLAADGFFEFGPTAHYGSTIAAEPVSTVGNITTFRARVTGLPPHAVCYYRFNARVHQGFGRASLGLAFATLNRPPTPQPDSFAILPGATAVLDVLDNDSDPDGDPVQLTSLGKIAPAQGKLARVNGKVQFTAASTFTGAAFSYGIQDGLGGSGTGAVTLTLGTSAIAPALTGLASAGDTFFVEVSADGAWSVNSPVKWVTGREDEAGAWITVQPNSGLAERRVIVQIAGKAHEIVQGGVQAPQISPPENLPPLMVSQYYEVLITTTNAPVTYAVANLPPGLTMNQATGVITGTPTKAGLYKVLINAKNAAAAAPEPISFDLMVQPLMEEMVGLFHGWASAEAGADPLQGGRLELTVTSTGAVTGKIVAGAAPQAIVGRLSASAAHPHLAQLSVLVPRPGRAPGLLMLSFDAFGNSATGTLADAPVAAWRQVWRPLARPATVYQGLHTFALTPPANSSVPQGYSFGSFTVDPKNGALKAGGKLADGSAFLTSSFIGLDGQVLIHQPLYGNKGSAVGALIMDTDHNLRGQVLWYKPAAGAKSKDNLYPAGFGAVTLTAFGSAYPSPGPGGVVMNLPNAPGNARLAFTAGGLAAQDEFAVDFDLVNPKGTGLTNTVTFPLVNPNRVTMPQLATPTGGFSGDFKIGGATAASQRKGTFHGQIVWSQGSARGYGFFLLPEAPNPTATTPRWSGRVILSGSE
jgi:uncharacterized delta-60 repeat protein